MNFQGKNVLVTGATGLVGSHVALTLLNSGAKVFVAQRSLNQGSYLVKTGLHKKVQVLSCDITNLDQVKKMFAESSPEYVFHLAGKLKPVSVQEAFSVNVMGTLNMLQVLSEHKTVKAMFLASSHRAYVGKAATPEIFSILPQYPYYLSKTVQELSATSAILKENLPVVIARFGNAFGPGDIESRIVSTIIKNGLAGKEVIISGQAVQNFISVKDAASGFLFLAEHSAELIGKAVNFITEWNFTPHELVEEISKSLGIEIKTSLGPSGLELPLNIPEGVDAKSLGWKPSSSFDEAVKDTNEWYKNE